MRGLTICQPYASLIVQGDKPVENRGWYTTYRGPLVIHAGKSRDWLPTCPEFRGTLVFGAVVGVAELYDCMLYERLPVDLRSHKHAVGPWCWLLRDVRRIEPIQWSGAQGLWNVPAALEARINAMLMEVTIRG